MSKRTEEDASEERVTAKSKPMMNLVSRCSVRDPNVLASVASERLKNKIWKSERTSELVEWAATKNRETCDERLLIRLLRKEQWWQELVFSRVEIWWNFGSKNEETRGWTNSSPRTSTSLSSMTMIGTLTPPQNRTFSLKSRSFLHRVNDRLRKILDQSWKRCNARHQRTKSLRLRSMIWRCLCLRHWKHLYSWETNTQKICIPSEIQGTISRWNIFDISEKLMVEHSDGIFGVSQISWEDTSWKISLVNDEEVISFSHAKVYVFSDSVLSLGKVNQKPTSMLFGKIELIVKFTEIQNFGHNWRRADGIREEYFTGFTTLQLCNKVHEFMIKMGDPSQFKGLIIFMSMFNDILWWSEDNEQECDANATLVSIFAKRFSPGRWSFLGPGSVMEWLF